MPAELLGAHMPTGKGLGDAIRSGHAIGCRAVQVFTSSPQQWKSKDITPAMVDDFLAAKEETGIECVVSHDSYLINLASVDEAKRTQSEDGLLREMIRCDTYGIPMVVSHMGAHMGQGDEEGLRKVIESTNRVLEQAPDSVMLLMETTAGQGSALNACFEQLAQILHSVDSPRLGVCLDTCHVFVASYDLRTEEAYMATWRFFDEIIGLKHLHVIHVNDSKKGLGSRVDRHEHIGEGEIGSTAFELLVNDPKLEKIPMMLETPDAPEGHARNLAKLQSFLRTY